MSIGAIMGWQRVTTLGYLILAFYATTGSDVTNGTIHYVSYDGGNIPPYTSWETATFRASFAAQYCQPNDTILVGAGTFFEPDSIDLSGGGTLMGVHRDSSEIVMQAGLYTLISGDGGRLVIKSLTIRSSYLAASTRALVSLTFDAGDTILIHSCNFRQFDWAFRVSAVYIEVMDCEFDECGHGGGAVCWLGWGCGNSRFERNTFIATYANDGWPEEFILLDINWNADSSVIRNNVFQGSYTAIKCLDLKGWLIVENNVFLNHFEAGSSPERTVLSNSPFARFSNNLFISRGPEPVNRSQLHVAGYREAYVTNNLFLGAMGGVAYDSAIYPFSPPPAYVYIQNNGFHFDYHRPNILKTGLSNFDSIYCEDIVDSSSQIIAHIENNICSSPMFADTVGFHLQEFSPAIDAGILNLLDANGSRSDIGPHGGPNGNSYSYEDLPPEAPLGLVAAMENGKVYLSFKKNRESDLNFYTVFRSEGAFVPLDSEHVAGYHWGDFATSYLDTSNIAFIDSLFSGRAELYYTVIATDNSFQHSQPATPVHLTLTDVGEDVDVPLPSTFVLNQNYPNPFNSSTAIVYSLPNIGSQPASVRLTIFNSLGQEVAVLVDQPQTPGKHIAHWDGRNKTGMEAASGVYFYTLSVSGIDFVKSKKLVLIK